MGVRVTVPGQMQAQGRRRANATGGKVGFELGPMPSSSISLPISSDTYEFADIVSSITKVPLHC